MNALPRIADGPRGENHVVIDERLIRKYGGNGPRYTSYPTADRFVEAFDETAYRHWLANRNIGAFARPLGLYVHLPFCDTICLYCACNKITTRDRGRAHKYVRHLEREMALVADALGDERDVARMHWGGGTPTFLDEEDTVRLVEAARPSASIATPSSPSRSTRARPTARASSCWHAWASTA